MLLPVNSTVSASAKQIYFVPSLVVQNKMLQTVAVAIVTESQSSFCINPVI